MKNHLVRIIFFTFFSFCCEAQYTKTSFLDSLKKTIYLKDYFEKHSIYKDSTYANYVCSFLPIDTFKIDSNSGFGFNPTSISICYQNSKYLNFYIGLGKLKWKNGKTRELIFYNYNGKKTALNWAFYKNEKIQKITYYKPELLDTVKQYGSMSNKQANFIFKKFRKSGILEITGEFHRGKKNGEWFYYDTKGILFKKEKFSNNKRISRLSF